MICQICGRPSRTPLTDVFDFKLCPRCVKKSQRVVAAEVARGPASSAPRAKHGERWRQVEEIIHKNGYVDAALLHAASGQPHKACVLYLNRKVFDRKLRRMRDHYLLPLQEPMNFGNEPALYFERIFGPLSDPMVMFNLRTRRALGINKACLKFTGRDLEAAAALDLSQLVLPEDFPVVQHGLETVERSGRAEWRLRVHDARGNVLWAEAHAFLAATDPDPLALIRMVFTSPAQVIRDRFVHRSFSNMGGVCESPVNLVSLSSRER